MKRIEIIASFYFEAEHMEAGEDALRAMLEKAFDDIVLSKRMDWKIIRGYDHGDAYTPTDVMNIQKENT